jgi:hypothetical protein
VNMKRFLHINKWKISIIKWCHKVMPFT